jgi:hypothetical protein
MFHNKLDLFILIVDGWTGTKEIHCFLDHIPEMMGAFPSTLLVREFT